MMIPLAARGDSLTIRESSDGGGITYTVSVDHISGGQIFYTVSGQMKSRPVSEVAGLHLDDEPDFNLGSQALDRQDYAAATESLFRCMTGTEKPWLKDWIAPKLLDAANQAGRFDAATAAWARLVTEDPATYADKKPPVPADLNHLAEAAKELDTAQQTASGTPRRLILGLLLDVESSRQDAQSAAAVARELEKMGVGSGAEGAGAMAEVAQQARVALARSLVGERKYDEAMRMIDQAAGILTDPARQSDALMLKAQSMEGKAAGGGTDAWKDAALAYMRVYVHFHDGPGSEHAADALMKTAQIEEKRLSDAKGALGLYQKVVSEYKDGSDAAAAASEVNRLQAAGN